MSYRTLLFCTFGFLFLLCLAQAQPCTPPLPGMVAWYTGDGNANDFFRNNNGVLQGGVTFAAGEVGMAFSLNGTNQFVTLPANFIPYPGAGSTSTTPMSVDAWFLTTGGGVILGQQAAVSPPALPTGSIPAIYVGTDGFLYVSLFWKGSLTPISSLTKVNNGIFHHVAVVYDGSTEAVYLDGALIGSTAFTQTGYASSYQYQIGTGYATAGWPGGNGGYFYFQGLIDEVEFFNRALSKGDVQAIFNAGKSGTCKMPSPSACAPAPSGMVDWYAADGNANDFIGKNNGTPQNGATFVTGEVGMAFSLNGTNQFVSLPTNFIPYPLNRATSTAPMSVDAWFLTTKGGVIVGQQGAVSPPVVPSTAVPAIYVGSDGLLYAELFWKGTSAPISSLTKVNDGAFHNVAVTYDGTSEDVYLDGALIGSTPFVQTGYASSYQYQIGAGYTMAGWPGGNGGYFYFQGSIDEVEFFDRALSQAEVLAIVHAGSSGTCANQPPVAICRNVTVPAGAGGTATASVNNGSFDPDLQDTITLGQAPPGPYPPGATTVTLTVTDSHGASSQCTGTVTVTSTTPPTPTPCNLTAKPNVLPAANHKMIPVTLTGNASGSCNAAACHIVSVSSNEKTKAGDWVITGNLTVNLRAEQSGKGSARVYTITVQCADAAGNLLTSTVSVTVAQDQGKNGDGKGQGNGNDNGDGNGDGKGSGNGGGNGDGKGEGGDH